MGLAQAGRAHNEEGCVVREGGLEGGREGRELEREWGALLGGRRR